MQVGLSQSAEGMTGSKGKSPLVPADWLWPSVATSVLTQFSSQTIYPVDFEFARSYNCGAYSPKISFFLNGLCFSGESYLLVGLA